MFEGMPPLDICVVSCRLYKCLQSLMVNSRPLDSDSSTYELCDRGQVTKPLRACFVCKMERITTVWGFCKEQIRLCMYHY